MATAAQDHKPTVEELLDRAKALAPLLQEEAAESEAQRRLSERTVKALRDGGFLNLLAPAEFGGFDLGPFDSLTVVEEIFRADGSAGFNTMAHNILFKPMFYMPREAVATMFEKGTPGLAGQGSPTGKAIKVEGGYRVSGNWSYGTNVLHADYVSGSCILTEDGAPVMNAFGSPTIVRWTAPVSQVELKGDWNVLGLEATGSVDFSVDDLFIPEAFANARGVMASKPADWVENPSPLSPLVWIFWGHTVAELGLGRQLFDLLDPLAFKPSPLRGRLADDAVFLTGYAKAQATFQAACAWNLEIWREIQEVAERGEPTSQELLTRTRAAMLHIQAVNADNAQFAFREAGGASLRDGPLQRAYRDIMAAGQHVIMARQSWSDCGKHMIGAADGMIWGPYALMPDPMKAMAEKS
jgi:indole-3-acetate monooxygenase